MYFMLFIAPPQPQAFIYIIYRMSPVWLANSASLLEPDWPAGKDQSVVAF